MIELAIIPGLQVAHLKDQEEPDLVEHGGPNGGWSSEKKGVRRARSMERETRSMVRYTGDERTSWGRGHR